MESRVDLDHVAELISRHVLAWERSGLVVGALTWRDEAAPWPSALREDRGQVAEPDSVGVVVRKHRQEGRLVIFRGGWADLEYWSGGPSDEAVLEAPGWDDWLDSPGVERLLRRFADLFERNQSTRLLPGGPGNPPAVPRPARFAHAGNRRPAWLRAARC